MSLGGDLGILAIWESNGYSAVVPYLIRHPPRVVSPTDAEIEGTFRFARPLPLDSRLEIGDPHGSQRTPRRGRPGGSLGSPLECFLGYQDLHNKTRRRGPTLTNLFWS